MHRSNSWIVRKLVFVHLETLKKEWNHKAGKQLSGENVDHYPELIVGWLTNVQGVTAFWLVFPDNDLLPGNRHERVTKCDYYLEDVLITFVLL